MARDPNETPVEPDGQSPRAELRALSESLEEALQAIEVLEERTNTLVRLLDLMGRRLDRLENER